MGQLKKLWQLLDRPMRWQMAAIAVMMLIGGGLEALGTGLIFPVLQALTDPASVKTSRWLAPAYDFLGQPEYGTFLATICGVQLMVLVFKNAFYLFSLHHQIRCVSNSNAEIATRLLTSYLRQPYPYHVTHNSPGLVRNVTEAVNGVFYGALLPLVMLCAEAVVALSVVGVLLVTEPVAALLITFVVGGPAILFSRLMRHRMQYWGLRNLQISKRYLGAVLQALNGIKEIKVLGREAHFIKAAHDLRFEHATVNEKYNFMKDVSRPIIEIFAILGLLVAMVYLLWRDGSATALLPTLGLFAMVGLRLMPSVSRITNLINQLQFRQADVDQVYRDLAAAPPAPAAGGDTSQAMRHSFRLDDICFAYADHAKALDHVSLEVRAGQSIGLVGGSGAGKTTLANIVLGLLTPDSGRILVDGRDVTGDSHRNTQVGFVPQDTFLIDDTLRRNVAFGLPDAEIDAQRLAKAITLAQLDGFLDSLPKGLDTVVGERGVRLSGGQRQRVAIARALYGDPEMLVLDEATSALDSATEAAIAESITSLHGQKTLIIVAHRLSTVKDCDLLFFLKDGRIADSGSFAELAERNTEFRRMIDHMDLSGSLARPTADRTC